MVKILIKLIIKLFFNKLILEGMYIKVVLLCLLIFVKKLEVIVDFEIVLFDFLNIVGSGVEM